MNRILVPVDFSDSSLNALIYTTKLFGGSALEITILHTYEVSSSAFRMKSMDRIMEDDAQREMGTLIKRMQKETPNISVKSKIIKNDAISTITSMGNSGIFDFVVMGTKGASGLKEVFIGSVAGGVISKTKAPVVVVPKNYEYRPLNEIVFAISGIPFRDVTTVEPLRKLTIMHNSKINVFHATEDNSMDLEEVVNTIEDLNPSVIYSLGKGSINQRLNEYLAREGAELLCLVRSKKDFFSRLFSESVTMKQTFSSPVPLLILHD